VTSTIERTLQLLTPDLGAGIEVDLQLASELPRVSIDPERLRQVLINLILNAAQAMDGHGRLVVRTVLPRRDPDASGRQSHMIEILVTDTGPGLPARVRENLFVPFVTTKDRGTGLGLAISQRIISAAGGRIEARSGREGGTTFSVLLPTGDASLEASGERQGASESVPPPREGAGDSATTLASER
jgi:signal transduction histidine kinase